MNRVALNVRPHYSFQVLADKCISVNLGIVFIYLLKSGESPNLISSRAHPVILPLRNNHI